MVENFENSKKLIKANKNHSESHSPEIIPVNILVCVPVIYTYS